MEERMPKERTTRSGSVIGINTAAAQCASDPRSPETPISQSESFMECSEPLMVRSCLTFHVNSRHCEIIPFSLSSHWPWASGVFQSPPPSPIIFVSGILNIILVFPCTQLKQNKLLGKGSLFCFTCNKTFSNAFSLRRHAGSTGHKVDLSVVNSLMQLWC